MVGGGAKVALGMDTGAARLSSWRSKKFCGAVMALKTSAANCPLNVAHMRALTDHAIPEFLLSENSAIEGAEVEGMRAEWHFPSEFLLHHIALHARATTLHGGCRSVVLRTDACAVGVCRLAADACLPACLPGCLLSFCAACMQTRRICTGANARRRSSTSTAALSAPATAAPTGIFCTGFHLRRSLQSLLLTIVARQSTRALWRLTWGTKTHARTRYCWL